MSRKDLKKYIDIRRPKDLQEPQLIPPNCLLCTLIPFTREMLDQGLSLVVAVES